MHHHCADSTLAGTETAALETGNPRECPQAQGCEGPVLTAEHMPALLLSPRLLGRGKLLHPQLHLHSEL